MKLTVEHPSYPELGQGQVISEKDGKASVEFENNGNFKTIVFPMSDLSVIASPRVQAFVYRDGEKYRPLEEVKKEQSEFVLSECVGWTTVQELVRKVTKHFSEYTMEDGSPLNQGGFDPMFCVTKKNPGCFIKTGLLIFRKARPQSGCQWEFKARTSASQQEIMACVTSALERNKFVFVESIDADNYRPGVQEVDPLVAAGGVQAA